VFVRIVQYEIDTDAMRKHTRFITDRFEVERRVVEGEHGQRIERKQRKDK
jgi:hypothetical protein